MSDITRHAAYQLIEEFYDGLRKRAHEAAKTKAGHTSLLALRLEAICRNTDDERIKDVLMFVLDDLKVNAMEIENEIQDVFYNRSDLNDIATSMAMRMSQLEDISRGKGDIHPLHHPETRDAVWRLTGGHCAYCDDPLEPIGKNDNSFCVEHVVPRSAGGPDNLANYVPSCHSCNLSKNGSHVLEFIDRRFPGRRRPIALAVAHPVSAPTSPEAALALFVEAA